MHRTSNFFESKAKKIGSNNKNDTALNLDENFDSCLGALKIIKDGWETEAIPRPAYKHGEKTSFFTKIFGN